LISRKPRRHRNPFANHAKREQPAGASYVVEVYIVSVVGNKATVEVVVELVVD
jgi:hypothetical protein